MVIHVSNTDRCVWYHELNTLKNNCLSVLFQRNEVTKLAIIVKSARKIKLRWQWRKVLRLNRQLLLSNKGSMWHHIIEVVMENYPTYEFHHKVKLIQKHCIQVKKKWQTAKLKKRIQNTFFVYSLTNLGRPISGTLLHWNFDIRCNAFSQSTHAPVSNVFCSKLISKH